MEEKAAAFLAQHPEFSNQSAQWCDGQTAQAMALAQQAQVPARCPSPRGRGRVAQDQDGKRDAPAAGAARAASVLPAGYMHVPPRAPPRHATTLNTCPPTRAATALAFFFFFITLEPRVE